MIAYSESRLSSRWLCTCKHSKILIGILHLHQGVRLRFLFLVEGIVLEVLVAVVVVDL